MIELPDDAHEDHRRRTTVDHTTEVDSTDSRSPQDSGDMAEGLGLLIGPLLLIVAYGTFVEGMEHIVLPLFTWMNQSLVGNIVMAVVALTAFGVVGALIEE